MHTAVVQREMTTTELMKEHSKTQKKNKEQNNTKIKCEALIIELIRTNVYFRTGTSVTVHRNKNSNAEY